MNSQPDQVQNHPERWLITIVLLAAVALRVPAMFSFSLSNDELSALTRARYDSVSDLVRNGVYIDYHPAGIELFIYAWIKWFGDDPFLYRLPFVLSGLVSVYLIYWIGKRWFSVTTGLLAAAAFAVLRFSFLYSFFARPYSPGLLFCLLTTIAWTLILFPKVEPPPNRSIWKWLFFIISLSACLHIHYFTFVFAAMLGMTGFFFLHRSQIIPYLLSGTIALLTFIPEWPVFLEQMKTGDIGGWLGAPGKGYLFDFIFQSFNHSLWLGIPIGIAVFTGIIWLLQAGEWSRFHTISLAWFLFSFILAYGYSILRHPVIQYSTLFFVFPFLLFVICSALESSLLAVLSPQKLVLFFLAACLLSTVAERKLFGRTPYGVFRELATDQKAWISKYGSDQVPVIVNVINPEYLRYYLRHERVEPRILGFNVVNQRELAMFSAMLDTLSSAHCSYCWSNSDHPFEINKIIQEHYPVLIEKNIYFNSASYLYAREGLDLSRPFWKWMNGYEDDTVPAVIKLRSAEFACHGQFGEKMDSSKVFSYTLTKKIPEIPGKGYRWVTARAWFYSTDTILRASLALQFDRGDKTMDYFAQVFSDFNLRPGRWQEAIISRLLPDPVKPEDRMKVYVWNPGRETFFIDDISVEVESGDDPYRE